MAIDPITAKILAQLAAQAATDEQARKCLLCIILGPVIFLLMLIALIIYLISSPFSALSGWLVGDELGTIENFQKDYGYNQSIGIYEQDYLDADGANYEDTADLLERMERNARLHKAILQSTAYPRSFFPIY